MNLAKILIVEDDIIIAESLFSKLTNLGYNPLDIVETGVDALKKVEALKPDLILMDISLEGDMDGVEAAGLINQQYNIPVIFVTAYSDPHTIDRARLAKPFSFLLKPFNERELISNIEMTLFKHGAEKKIKENEFRIRTLLETIPNGVFECDVDGAIRLVNTSMTNIFGYDRETIIGMNLRDLIGYGSKRNEFRELISKLPHGDPLPTPYITKCHTGFDVELTVQIDWTTKTDAQGKVIRIVGILSDITKRIHTEQSLKKQNEFILNLLESVADPFYVVDVSNYQILLANSASGFETIKGSSKCFALTHQLDTPCDKAGFACPLEDMRRTKEQTVVEHIHFNGKGTQKVYEVRGYPVLDSDGNLSQMIEYLLDITERKLGEARLRELASTDTLTGISNRRHFFELAEKEYARSIRYERLLSIIIFDVDHFKNVNDTYGHAVGDAVLISIASNCRQILRENDIYGRYGGEEFAIMLPETNINEARQVATRLCKGISDQPVQYGQEKIRVKISLGLASLSDPAITLDKLLGQADNALYSAKKKGRNQVDEWRNL